MFPCRVASVKVAVPAETLIKSLYEPAAEKVTVRPLAIQTRPENDYMPTTGSVLMIALAVALVPPPPAMVTVMFEELV